MSLDAAIVAAIDAGGAIIVPSAQRAEALRFAWARVQHQRGLAVWNTPAILTWEAWLSQQWRNATLAQQRPDGRQLLSLSQERLLWEQALQQLVGPGDDPAGLLSHAAALMRAAAEATQSLLSLATMAVTDEEQLLVAALRAVRELCSRRNLVSLRLALPADLQFLMDSAAPVVVGQSRLTPLQQQVQELYWPAIESLLAPVAMGVVAEPALCRTAHLDAEVAACAQWCRAQLLQDGARRLLVISAWQDPGAHTQGALLWRALAGNGNRADEQAQMLLAVEGGEPLHFQALIADALTALAVPAEWVETEQLLQLLRSPYFNFGSADECCALQGRFGTWGMARLHSAALRDALLSVASRLPAAGRMLAWLDQARALLAETPRRSAIGWAECFSQVLRAANFAASSALASRDAQRLLRWSELLDEFSGLDAALRPLTAATALQTLRRLAQQSIHQSATGDAAITLTTQMQDPVIYYDGIWVMGLTESRWPAPPRPDPYVPLHEQRRHEWPQAGVSQRLRAAQWLQDRWRLRTDNLVLSYAQREGDVRHRPSALTKGFSAAWQEAQLAADVTHAGLATAESDQSLPPMSVAELLQPLRGGVERLRVQQECAFHAQAQWRLGAEAIATLTDGIPSRLRGMLLHSALEGLWSELQDQQRLLALTPAAQSALIAKHWGAAVRDNTTAGVAWLAPGVLEREQGRATRLIDRVLQLDRERAPFVVEKLEYETAWGVGAAALVMRIDRIDRSVVGDHLVIDYKSGAAGSIHLHDGAARPLQLAAYVVALADSGIAVDAALLLSLKPAQFGYAGAADLDDSLPRRVKQVEDWPQVQQQWRDELQQLLAQHLEGSADLAQAAAACRYCHLSALCRRHALGDALPDEEDADE